MKIEVTCSCKIPKFTVVVSGAESVTQQDEETEPALYPGLKDLVNPTSADVVEHVLNNPPRVRWVLEEMESESATAGNIAETVSDAD